MPNPFRAILRPQPPCLQLFTTRLPARTFHDARHVRVLGPTPTVVRTRRTALFFFSLGLCLWAALDLLPDEDDEDQTPGGSEDKEKPGDAPLAQVENSRFIPLGLPRPGPISYYKPTDPEWIRFVRLNQRDVLQQVTMATAKKASEQYAIILGSNVQLSSHSIGIDFPYNPPPEFHRPGLELVGDELSWTLRPVDTHVVLNFLSLTDPTSLIGPLWAGSKAFFEAKFPNARLPGVLSAWSRDPSLIEYPGPDDFAPAAPAKPKTPAPRGQQVEESSTPPKDSQPAQGLAQHLPKLLPSTLTSGEGVPEAVHAIRDARFQDRLQRKLAFEPRRGGFMMQGMFELRGNRGGCTFFMRAAVYPAQKSAELLDLRPLRIQPNRQGAKGHP